MLPHHPSRRNLEALIGLLSLVFCHRPPAQRGWRAEGAGCCPAAVGLWSGAGKDAFGAGEVVWFCPFPMESV